VSGEKTERPKKKKGLIILILVLILGTVRKG
jgi:hypothetical protein